MLNWHLDFQCTCICGHLFQAHEVHQDTRYIVNLELYIYTHIWNGSHSSTKGTRIFHREKTEVGNIESPSTYNVPTFLSSVHFIKTGSHIWTLTDFKWTETLIPLRSLIDFPSMRSYLHWKDNSGDSHLFSEAGLPIPNKNTWGICSCLWRFYICQTLLQALIQPWSSQVTSWYLIPCQNLQISGTLLPPNVHMQQVPLQNWQNSNLS